MSSASTEARMEARVHRESRWRQRLAELWGTAPPYAPQPEDASGYLFGSLYYTWASDVMMEASKENLTPEGMPHPTQTHRAYDAGHAVSLSLQDQWCARHRWDECVGMSVSTKAMRKTQPTLKGVLRYVGEVQQYRTQGALYAGIEWLGMSAEAALRAAPDTSQTEGKPGAILNDGVVLGEQLFEVTTGNSSERGAFSSCCDTPCFVSFEPVKEVIFLDAPMASEADFRKTAAQLDVSTIPPPPSTISILMALIKALGWEVLYLLPFRALADACTLLSPVLLQRYISYLEGENQSWRAGMLLVLGYLVILLVKTCVNNKFSHMNQRLSITFRSALTAVLFEKCFTISPRALSHPDFNAGRLVNMMSSDVQRVERFVSFFWSIISAPVQLCVAIYLLYSMVGVSALVGILVMLLSLPFHAIMMGMSMRLFQARARATDARMRATNEFLSGIRVAKFMAWEPSFVVNIEEKRRQEVNIIKRVQLFFLSVIFVLNATPSLVIASVFLSYTLTGHELTPSVVFPTMSLLMILQMPFVVIPLAFQSLVQVLVSVRRIAGFVASDDTPDGATRMLPDTRLDARGHEPNGGQDNRAAPLSEEEDSAIREWAMESAVDQHQRAASASSLSALFFHTTITAFTAQRLPDTPEEHLKKMKKEEAARRSMAKSAVSGAGKPSGPPGRGRSDSGEAAYYTLTPKPLLVNITLMIPKGGLTMILGATGSGKSTLLDALVGAIAVTEGDVRATDAIAYVPQRPWIMNATLKENILFFSDYDHARFDRALKSSQLIDDLNNLNGGIEAEIGERGINVSGGQKARVSLARAVYADKELYLLDDPLSALDAHVGERVMHECILGVLAHRTRVLATHQVQWARHADYVVVLNGDGTVRFQGDAARYAIFADLDAALPQGELIADTAPLSPATQERAKAVMTSLSSGSFAPHATADDASLRQQASLTGSVEILLGDLPANVADTKTDKQRVSLVSGGDGSDGAVGREKGEVAEDTPGGRLMTIEEKAVGSVPKEVYLRFIEACGGIRQVTSLVLAFIGTECLSVGPQLWLTAWSTNAFHYSLMHYLLVYLLLTSLNTLCAPARQYFLQTLFRRAGRELHSALLRSVTCGTMAFFDTTPLGRIVNRFAKDMDQVDSSLSMDYSQLLNSFFAVISSMTVMIVTQYVVVLVLLPCCYIYRRLMTFFNAANREIQRLSNISNSPIFQILSETMGGRWTIAAYQKATIVMQETFRRLDTVFACTYTKAVANRWLSVRIETMTSFIVCAVAFIGVLAVHVTFLSTNVGLVALSMTMANNISNMLNQVIMQVAAVEADMNCVERIFFYVDNIEHEDMADDLAQEVARLTALETSNDGAKHGIDPSSAGQRKQGQRNATAVTVIANPDDELTEAQLRAPPRDAKGQEMPSIEFVHASLRYRAGLPLVLRDVSFAIHARQRVGIVGRTGSGKSTMLLAFLRLVDLAEGEMRVRGVPAKQYTLRRLRQLFSMIPQDPVLFEGTVRTNLDPFLESTDDAIWTALEHVGMADRVRYGTGGPSSTPTSRRPPQRSDPGSAADASGSATGTDPSATGLDGHVQEGGLNYSVGQRQLLCMARALLRHRSCFLLMDEATANVDPQLDKQIQDTVYNVFKDYTVITIAHRLVTVASYDLILFMENGCVVERASPRALLEQKPTTRFATLVHAMDPIAVDQFMRAMKPAELAGR